MPLKRIGHRSDISFLGEEEEPELGEITTLDLLRIALVRHFKRHKMLLRANRGEPDRDEIMCEVLTFIQRR